MLKPIQYAPYPPDNRPEGEPCPKCGVRTRYSMISCPDRRSGCLVAHHGWLCDQCGTAYTSSDQTTEDK
jgi:hypothetical protein